MKDDGGRNWVKAPLDSSSFKYDSGSVLSVLPEMCSQGRHKKLSDFDDHLNDISRFASSSCASGALANALVSKSQLWSWLLVLWHVDICAAKAQIVVWC